ncbi:MAG TPA: AAA family ATPase [Chloroflexota bacterium]|nr:AAA family ATPase [Chloroflexota bacterium]
MDHQPGQDTTRARGGRRPDRGAGALPPFIRALLEPAAYPEPRPAAVELRQTHISYVLLAGERVYKIKKPVALGFLDYSTPARRAYYCRREVALNRRFAPDVYLGVVPIVERAGAVRVGGRGRVVERAVAMRRLPEEGMLTRLLAAGTATPALLEQIARRVAAFHAAAAAGPRVARYGTPGAVRHTVQDNLARCAPYVGRTLDAATYAHLQAWTAAYLREQRDLFQRRVAEQRIRDGHGDLHAASVCVVDAAAWRDGALAPWTPPGHAGTPPRHDDAEGEDRPSPRDSQEHGAEEVGARQARGGDEAGSPAEVILFDCIDFSSQLRCTDVAAEVAFLAMDLDRHGRADLRAAFVEAYVVASDDRALPTLLPFYQSYRATVRGLVASIAAADKQLDGAARAAQRTLARGYFDLARYAYTGGARRPFLLLLGGLPASGKSTLAHALAERLALVPLNSDVVRKERAGLAPTARQGARPGAGLYTAATTDATYAALLDAARGWLERGVSVALDASFRRADHRAAAVALAARLGVPWLAVECVCAPDTARARLAARAHDVQAVSDADWAVYQQLAAEWEPWEELPAGRHRRVDTGRGLDAAVEAVLAAVRTLA